VENLTSYRWVRQSTHCPCLIIILMQF
jgi:hypothetical protein